MVLLGFRKVKVVRELFWRSSVTTQQEEESRPITTMFLITLKLMYSLISQTALFRWFTGIPSLLSQLMEAITLQSVMTAFGA